MGPRSRLAAGGRLGGHAHGHATPLPLLPITHCASPTVPATTSDVQSLQSARISVKQKPTVSSWYGAFTNGNTLPSSLYTTPLLLLVPCAYVRSPISGMYTFRGFESFDQRFENRVDPVVTPVTRSFVSALCVVSSKYFTYKLTVQHQGMWQTG